MYAGGWAGKREEAPRVSAPKNQLDLERNPAELLQIIDTQQAGGQAAENLCTITNKPEDRHRKPYAEDV